MANSSGTLQKWREYFRSSTSDIFSIIEHAIMVAASDCPYDFNLKRDRIAEMLFTCKITKCLGCEGIELAVPCEIDAERRDEKYKIANEAGGSKDTKESKVHSNRDDDHIEMNGNHASIYGFGEAEALTDVLEEESQFIGEILRIKEIIDNSEEESDLSLFDSLRRLQLMPFSVGILKATEIGKSVNALRKHGSKEIRNLVKTLVGNWKIMVDEWASATGALQGVATESVETSAFQEDEGLPSPPMDEGAFFAAHSPLELAEFFDGMDEDGNPQNSGEFNKNQETGRRLTPETTILTWKDHTPTNSSVGPNDIKAEQKRDSEAVVKKHTPVYKSNKQPGSESGPGRPKPTLQNNNLNNNEIKFQQKPDKGIMQKKPLPPRQDVSNKLRGNDEGSVRIKLEAAKRKLHERYQEAENAKKQRTVQVVELRDLPKQSLTQRNQHPRPGNRNRQWANGRR